MINETKFLYHLCSQTFDLPPFDHRLLNKDILLKILNQDVQCIIIKERNFLLNKNVTKDDIIIKIFETCKLF